MHFKEILICYDISDTKSRTKLFEALKDFGLQNVQNSVFWGYVLPSEKESIKALFVKYCSKDDKVLLLNAKSEAFLKDSFNYKISSFKKPDDFEFIC